MIACEFRKLYITVNKVGVECIKNDGERRITCELVCLECDCGKNFPRDEFAEMLAQQVEEVTSEEVLDIGCDEPPFSNDLYVGGTR